MAESPQQGRIFTALLIPKSRKPQVQRWPGSVRVPGSHFHPQVPPPTTASTSISPGVRGHGAVSVGSWDTSCSHQLTTAARAAHSPQFGRRATRAQSLLNETCVRNLRTTPTKTHLWVVGEGGRRQWIETIDFR